MLYTESMNKENYLEAKKLLHASIPERIVSRTKETDDIKTYLETCFNDNKTLSLYVNGPPGTGKTVSICHVLDSLKKKYAFKQVNINCMAVKNAQQLYKTLLMELSENKSSEQCLTPKRSTKDSLCKIIETKIMSEKKFIVLVLDEIDQIETTVKNPTDLYRIFEWPYLQSSKLILIGIANALDFTDRLLPRLQLKPNTQPKLVNFVPYSRSEIIEIVKDRLKDVKSIDGKPLIDERALIWCASKIASSSGDIRKMLDICRHAIEILEKDAKIKENVTTVGVNHMMKIFNDINPMTTANFDRNSMPLLHKILLCTLLLCNKELQMKECILSKIFDKFNKICKKYLTAMDSESEFYNLCTLVQDNGYILLKKSKDIRNTKISLQIDEQELIEKLQDEELLADILSNKMYR